MTIKYKVLYKNSYGGSGIHETVTGSGGVISGGVTWEPKQIA